MTQAQITSSWDGRRWVDSPDARRSRLASLVDKLDDLTAARHLQQKVTSGPCDMIAIEREAYTSANIEIATKAILAEVREMLATCPIHADGALVTGCADCAAAADRRGGPTGPSEIRLATRPR